MAGSEQAYDPHTSVSAALTEVRTVLNRARTARHHIGEPGITPGPHLPAGYNGYLAHEGADVERMEVALDEVIKLLEPWERRR